MRENGEKGVSIQNVEWDSDGYAELDIGMVLVDNDGVIFAMITKRPVGWWVLKVEVSLGNQWDTQGNSTTLCVFKESQTYPRGSAQHSSFVVEMAFLSGILQLLDGGMILMIAEQQVSGQRLPIVGSRGSSLEKRAYISWIKIVQLSTKPLATSLD
ncbi:uncharacterized protein EAE98_010579 [Botrytis deweyae]|uniref:Uncharacterized protein n=1 Tax=Botrytis deweyae TaxID=2478750 RepID=A0ABQ7I8R7_9HELO|nr:uncharacterized protein EAE98_010579 [Botrytis deweyae]KAF7916570.1 hypothetical protein EAE98_010579 [Botrytis deweyae]